MKYILDIEWPIHISYKSLYHTPCAGPWTHSLSKTTTKVKGHWHIRSSLINYPRQHRITWKCVPGWGHSGLWASLWSCQFTKTGVVSANMALPFWAPGIIQWSDNVTSCSKPLSRCTVVLNFPHDMTPLFLLLSAATISSSLHLSFLFTWTFPPLEMTLGLASVLVRIAGSNTSPARASPVHSGSGKVSYTGRRVSSLFHQEI